MHSLWVSLEFFGFIFAELTVLFLGISTLVGLLLQYVSDETLRRWLSRRGWLGNFLGAALGAVTPFCSCSTIPMTVGLLRAGVPFGRYDVLRPGVAPAESDHPHDVPGLAWVESMCGLRGGDVCHGHGLRSRSGRAGTGEGRQERPYQRRSQEREKLPTFRRKLRRAFAGAWGDFRGVLVYLVIGVAIGAAVYGYVPGDFVVRMAGPQNPLAIPVAGAHRHSAVRPGRDGHSR